ncbi:class I SAM-dependent methyltransferase [Methylobacterium pseudosasicola]|uniref:class I SAM-dependent methyltransferase n=1 Tax=Methylobacterium pseudosasicola TaxID=582667 RepID=UPI001FCDB7F0|nr:methyltransferase domain-containing protein [Methylobacterium pseudosasicola]
MREEMYKECFAYLKSISSENLDTLEIAAGNQWVREINFRSYTETHFPDFDICSMVLEKQFDLIIADQVFEHLPWPRKAAQNVYKMLKPNGVFLIATPFLVRVHNVPIDCSRWTEKGLSYLLQDGGFNENLITTRSWGNRECVVGNFNQWRKRGLFGSRRNEPDFPVMVWAYARKEIS